MVFWNISVTWPSVCDTNNLNTPFIMGDMVSFLRWSVENLQTFLLLSLAMHEQIWVFFPLSKVVLQLMKCAVQLEGQTCHFLLQLRQFCPKQINKYKLSAKPFFSKKIWALELDLMKISNWKKCKLSGPFETENCQKISDLFCFKCFL